MDTEWLFKSFLRVFSSCDVAFVSVLEVFPVEEDINVEDVISNDDFSSTGDVAVAGSDVTSVVCETTAVVSELSTGGTLSGAIASVNYKFFS